MPTGNPKHPRVKPSLRADPGVLPRPDCELRVSPWRTRGLLRTLPRCFRDPGERGKYTSKRTRANSRSAEPERTPDTRKTRGRNSHCDGGSGRGGAPGEAGVSGVRDGALGRGQRRLPIAHNETALSAGSGAEGKHGEGARPGQEEAGGRGGGGECSWVPFALCPFQTRFRGASPVGSPVSRVEGGPGPRGTLTPSSAGLLASVARTRDPPGQRELSSRA